MVAFAPFAAARTRWRATSSSLAATPFAFGGMIKDWLGIDDFNPSEWVTFNDVQSWWEHLSLAHGSRRKAMPSLIMLVSWSIWNERNARVFKHTSALPSIIFARIKLEAKIGSSWGQSNWVI